MCECGFGCERRMLLIGYVSVWLMLLVRYVGGCAWVRWFCERGKWVSAEGVGVWMCRCVGWGESEVGWVNLSPKCIPLCSVEMLNTNIDLYHVAKHRLYSWFIPRVYAQCDHLETHPVSALLQSTQRTQLNSRSSALTGTMTLCGLRGNYCWPSYCIQWTLYCIHRNNLVYMWVEKSRMIY